jgi:hypothetical protein
MGQTLGQKRVMASFNPSEEDSVDIIKAKAAELIDLLEGFKAEGVSAEKLRLIDIAQYHVESAAMYGVKAVFVE